MTRVAAVDCGTNSIRLLIADVDGGRLSDLVRRMEIVRLGAGVDRTKHFDEAALGRTFAALDDYAAEIGRAGVERVRMVATSASRDVDNRAAFVDGVRARLGVDPDVVSGDEEAQLSFAGALSALQPGVAQPYLVVDIGGGSTEFVVGDATGVTAARSVDVGCVRMTERHLHDDPPTPEQIAAATADVDAAIAQAATAVPLDDARTLVGLAGSVTTVAALVLGLEQYDASRIHGSVISANDVYEIARRLLAASHAERAAMPVMHPGRVDVIGAGALVLDRILARTGLEAVVVSEHDILDGIALDLASDRRSA